MSEKSQSQDAQPQAAPQISPPIGPRGTMPLRFRIPAIFAGVAILWWIMNGGANVLINGAVEMVARPDRSIENALALSQKKRPEGTAWLKDLLERTTAETGVIPGLRGLDYVIYHEGVRSESLSPDIHSGCFYDAASERAFFDVACFGALDQFARPRPDLAKAIAVAIVLAKRVAPELDGEALIAEAGRLAEALRFFPPNPSTRSEAAIGRHFLFLTVLDKRRDEDKPLGWINHHVLPVTDAAAAAQAFRSGLGL